MSMQSAVILRWLVSDGDVVEVGQPLYAVETDKTEVEISSPLAGTIRIVAEVGIDYPVGAVVAEVDGL
jgi:pyruvate/2-oxoglutarate dehydrogenase complex dihydrolipoamide acyltransferase (E2) component